MGAEKTGFATTDISPLSSDDDAATPARNVPSINGDAESGLKPNLREDADGRQAFLSTFTATDSKKIMSKVDRRFFIMIGLMFMIKNVRDVPLADQSHPFLKQSLTFGSPAGQQQRKSNQSPTSW